jgi:hypothetical protein
MNEQKIIEHTCFELAYNTVGCCLGYLITQAEESGDKEIIEHLQEAQKHFYKGAELFLKRIVVPQQTGEI